jgi:hypothetical protein
MSDTGSKLSFCANKRARIKPLIQTVLLDCAGVGRPDEISDVLTIVRTKSLARSFGSRVATLNRFRGPLEG